MPSTRTIGALSLGFMLAAGLARLSAGDDGQRLLSIDHYVSVTSLSLIHI